MQEKAYACNEIISHTVTSYIWDFIRIALPRSCDHEKQTFFRNISFNYNWYFNRTLWKMSLLYFLYLHKFNPDYFYRTSNNYDVIGIQKNSMTLIRHYIWENVVNCCCRGRRGWNFFSWKVSFLKRNPLISLISLHFV